jgi:hypothetical protein
MPRNLAELVRFVGQAILPAAAFQAALGCGYAALWGRMESCGRLAIGLTRRSFLPARDVPAATPESHLDARPVKRRAENVAQACLEA